MIDEYFVGTVQQLIERCRCLIGKVPSDHHRDYDTLERVCGDRLRGLAASLRELTSGRFQHQSLRPEKFRKLKRIVGELDIVENVGIAALHRTRNEDHWLNLFLERVTREIKYPLVTPIVTPLSRQYFCIYPSLNLLCVPLAEADYLLHLPDLYHELGHPLLSEMDDPRIEPFQIAAGSALLEVFHYIETEQEKEDRRRGPELPKFLFHQWRTAWAKYWMTEFFCDLFGVFTLGPAFAWSHIHLVAKNGGNPFDAPMYPSSHPADDARMRTMLVGLALIGFADDAAAIERVWHELMSSQGTQPEPEYHRCYPDELTRKVAEHALDGVKKIGCRIAAANTGDLVHRCLNDAWTAFWSDSSRYIDWEKQAISTLRASITRSAI